ncbi:MAG: hypothetical protein GYB66_15435, partial [Chloroflexi bacterium]|nr:hypothetical protein [Chloroflexota bacterium]
MRHVLLAVTAVLILYALLWPDAPYFAPDTTDYLRFADDLQDLRQERMHYRTIGYPLILCVVGSGRGLYYTQLAMHGVAVGLLATLLHGLGTGRRWIAVFLVLSLLPPTVETAAEVLTETVTQFYLVIGVVGLVGWKTHSQAWWLVASGLAFSLAAVTRPAYQLLAVIIILTMLIGDRRRNWRAVLALGITTLIVVGGYSIYNAYWFDYPGVTPYLGFNLSTRTTRFVERLPDEYATEREILVHHRDQALLEQQQYNEPGITHTGVWYILRASPDLQEALGKDEAGLAQHMVRLNLILIYREPLEYLTDVGRAMVTFWFPFAQHANFGSRWLYLIWSVVHFSVIGVWAASAMAVLCNGLFIKLRRPAPGQQHHARQLAMWLCGGIVIYTMVVSSAFNIGEPRHRMPTELLIFTLLALQQDSLTR